MRTIMKTKKSKFLVGALSVSLLLGSSVAFATSAPSQAKIYGPVLGIIYGSTATVHDNYYGDTRNAVGETKVTVGENKSVSAGYIGLYDRLFKGTAICATDTDFDYNTSDGGNTVSMKTQTGGDCGSGNYKSYGRTAAYNGNGYTIYDTYVSPYVYFNSPSARALNSEEDVITLPNEYKINKNGETYGSALGAEYGFEPDLIEAYGTDGTIGYVRSEALNPTMPKTPEEAIARQSNRALRKNDATIPLYDVNGEKVVGEFQLVQSEVTEIVK